MATPQKVVGETALTYFWGKLKDSFDETDERIDDVQDQLAENTQAITNQELEAMLT